MKIKSHSQMHMRVLYIFTIESKNFGEIKFIEQSTNENTRDSNSIEHIQRMAHKTYTKTFKNNVHKMKTATITQTKTEHRKKNTKNDNKKPKEPTRILPNGNSFKANHVSSFCVEQKAE